MAIRIVRNDAGNCITFENTTLPVYWNACLSGELNESDNTKVNVINDIKTGQTGENKYEMEGVSYTEFEDKDGNLFNTAQAVVDYINENGNVIGASEVGTDMIGVDINFRLDQQGTSIIADNGLQFGVNTIKAVPATDGTIHIHAIGDGIPTGDEDVNDRVHLQGIEVGRAYIDRAVVPGGISDVVNALNELFEAGAFEAVVITDPEATVIADVQGVVDQGTNVGANAIDPVGVDILGTTATHNNAAGYLSAGTIDQAGEYFTFDIAGKATYGFGLVHTQESYDAGHYSGNASYADPAGFCVGANSSHLGYQFAHHFHIGNAHASWTNYGANTSYVMGEAWYDHNNRFDLKDEWNAGDPVKVKVGISELGFITISTLNDDGVNWRLHARSAYPVPQGSEFRLGIKLQTTGARLRTQPKIHLRAEEEEEVTIGDTNIDLFGTATGTLGAGVTVSDASGDNDGFITAEILDAAGEYFEFEVNENEDHLIGLFSEDDYDVATVQADTANWLKGKYMFFGGRINTNEQLVSTVYKNGSGAGIGSTVLNRPTGCTHFRIGFDTQGRATIWSSTDGINFIESLHHTSAAPTGDYKLIWVADSSGATFESLSEGQLSLAPTMNFRYIESPDGSFNYPHFATEEEANYYDSQNGGTGASTTITYPDDPTLTSWYMPDNGFTADGVSAPTSAILFEGTPISWTEITSLTNADLVPPTFTAATLTVDELSAVNYQTQPQDTGYSTSITNLPAGLTDQGGGIIGGTAPEVTGDNVTNPSDDYTITVTRTNSYGSSTGTLTLTVTNLTAPVITAITGFTHNASSTALIDSDTLDSGSVVSVDETLGEAQRFIISRSYVEANILPSILQTGGKFYIGVLNTGADVSSIEDADFDFALVWEYQTATTHRYRVIKDGVQQHSVGIGSNTNALYDYAIEIYNGNAWLIGCSVNAINTEPSPAHGGSFSNATQVTLGESTPVTLSMAYVGDDDADISTTGLSEIVVPVADNWIQVNEIGSHVLEFDGSTTFPTLQAGYTYRFLMGDVEWTDQLTNTNLHSDETVRFTSDGTTEYVMTNVTRSGTPGTSYAYFEFTVPSNVPPLWWYTDHSGASQTNGVNISGSTYVAPVTGVAIEGPVANFTGNVINSGSNGWISLNETLSAGERLVLDSTFLDDLNDALPDHCIFWVGLKDGAWTDTGTPTSAFKGGAALRFYNTTAPDIGLRMLAYANGGTSQQLYTNSLANASAFIEITSSGNNIRLGYENGQGTTYDNASSTPYGDWYTNYKAQTGDQGYGITSLDVVIYWQAISGNTVGFDISDVDWTGLSEINVPTPAVTNLTNWSKALDFSGSSERAQQVGVSTNYMPIGMDGLSVQNTSLAQSGYTSNGSYSRPWACAVVFRHDGNNSNQHIWNQGEGAGSSDDNIYLRIDSSSNLYFGWGRSGATNEVRIMTSISTQFWYGVYIAHDGRRWASAGATAGNLYQTFDIRVMTGHDNFGTLYDYGTYSEWNQASSTTGARMDRTVTGNFTIGGRGSNRNFHGKVASMVVTTLRVNQPMPLDAEIEMMIKDPMQWMQDYKVNQLHRYTSGTAEATFITGGSYSTQATQIWLMGDGIQDSYANGIRNQVWSGDQNTTKLNLISMVSNDIETVSIGGLS